MKPELLALPHISSYSAFLLAGLIAGYWWARRRSVDFGIAPRHVDNLGLILVVAGLCGARFFSRLFDIPGSTLGTALQLWKGGGLIFYGGVVVGAAALLVYAAVTRIAPSRLANLLAPSIAIGLAFGRFGCFMAGCCWGDICANRDALAEADVPVLRQIQTVPSVSSGSWPLAVRFPQHSHPYDQHLQLGLVDESATHSMPVHPTQLYEALFAFTLALFLGTRRRENTGNAFVQLVTIYAVGRFLLEYLRADTAAVHWGFSLSQVISLLVLIAVGASVLARRWRRLPTMRQANEASAIAGSSPSPRLASRPSEHQEGAAMPEARR